MIGSPSHYPGLENFAARDELVMIGITYRLNSFGWLTLPELDETDPRGVSSNRGMLDMLMALQWIQDNAPAFGGDPSRVTLLDQSSGATAILAMLASHRSAGLFSAAIALSGSPNITMDLKTAQGRFRPPVLTACGLPADAVGKVIRDCLDEMPADKVATLLPNKEFNVGFHLPHSATGAGYPALTVVDGDTIDVPIQHALGGVAAGGYKPIIDVPLYLMTMQAEMDSFSNDASINALSTDQYLDMLQETFDEAGFPEVRNKPEWTWCGSRNCGHYFDSSPYRGLGWMTPEEMRDQFEELYSHELAMSTELAYQTYGADVGFMCGNAFLAETARVNPAYKSPVYLNYGVQVPYRCADGRHAETLC